MSETDTNTEAIERLAETLLFRGHHHQEKINHLLRRLHVERITAAKTLRALAAERDRLREENRRLREERERLALAVCGGEDVPGLANSLSVEALEGVAANNRSDSISTINEMLRAEAALTEARAETGALIDKLKRGLDALRSEASRGPVTGRQVFALTDPLMDAISRFPADETAALAKLEGR